MPLFTWRTALGVTAWVVALAVVWWVGSPGFQAWALVLATLVLLGTTMLGALARARLETTSGLNWNGVASFALLGCCSALLQIFQLLRHGIQAPHPPLASMFIWLPAMVFFILAFSPPSLRAWSPGRVLDGGVFGLAAYLGLWMWVLKPMAAIHTLAVLPTLGVHATFLLACLTTGITLHTWAERGDPPFSPVGLLALGITGITLILPWWVSVLLGASFQYAHPIRLAFLPGFLLIYLSTQAPWPTPDRHPREALRLALPYLPTGVAFVGFLAHYLPRNADRDATGLALLGALAIFVLLRQALTLRQLFRLNRRLEEKVEERTRELSRSQALLMETQQKNLVATLGAGLTHDLNNLLGAALGNLDLLRLKIGPLPAPRELEGLEKALDRAGNLSKSLMGLARSGPGPSQTFDLLAHLDELHPLLRAMVPRTIHLTCEHGDRPLPIRATPGQVDQVLVNLVSNAKDATPSGGRISLRATEEGATAVIEVQDTGTGIPESVMEHLFQPFHTTKAPGKGTGLGLSSVQAVVEHMGGSIQVRTKAQEGTTFTVRLPKALGPESPLG